MVNPDFSPTVCCNGRFAQHLNPVVSSFLWNRMPKERQDLGAGLLSASWRTSSTGLEVLQRIRLQPVSVVPHPKRWVRDKQYHRSRFATKAGEKTGQVKGEKVP